MVVSQFTVAALSERSDPLKIRPRRRFRCAHTRRRMNYDANSRVRAMGAGLKLCGRRNAGSEFPVENMLSPFE